MVSHTPARRGSKGDGKSEDEEAHVLIWYHVSATVVLLLFYNCRTAAVLLACNLHVSVLGSTSLTAFSVCI